MIPAAEALTLPTAQLSADELEAANKLESEIETFVRKEMRRDGINIQGTESRGTVIAEVNQRLIAAGYGAGWEIIVDQHPLNKAVQVRVGYRLTLSPTRESYQAAARDALS